MKFAEPLWLFAGLAACGVLVWAWRRYDSRQRASLAAFASSHLHAQLTASFSTGRRNLQRALFAASVALLFVALARPQAGFRWEEVKRKGVEILFAVDTSKSMTTPDVKPDRLTRAKLAIDDFVGKLDGDGVGLVAFAGNAFLQCPIHARLRRLQRIARRDRHQYDSPWRHRHRQRDPRGPDRLGQSPRFRQNPGPSHGR